MTRPSQERREGMMGPWIIEQIKEKERQGEWKPDELELPVGDELPGETPTEKPEEDGYTEPGRVTERKKRKKPDDEEQRVIIIEGTQDGPGKTDNGGERDEGEKEDDGEDIEPIDLNIITTHDIGADEHVVVNPNPEGNVSTTGDIIEGRPNEHNE